jgi:pimeloyl-ACP methyl ester carboxylesterase
MSDTQFTLSSGRKIGVSSFGNPAADQIILFCNPTPAAGAYNPDALVTDRYNVHVTTIDRPGYGGSDPWDDESFPTVQCVVDDIREYLDLAGISERVSAGEMSISIVGWGWGGATALAFAAQNPALIKRAAIVGLVKPARARRGDKAPGAIELWRPHYISSVAGAARTMNVSREPQLETLGADPADPDLAALGAVGQVERLIDSAADNRMGIAFDRLSARNTSWSDDLKHLQSECLFVYGDRDTVASNSDAEWYRHNIPHSTIVQIVESGRMAIVPAWDTILRYLTDSGE